MEHITQVFPKKPSPCNCLNIRRASSAVTQFYEKMLKPSGLTVPQMALLAHLEQSDQISVNELANKMRIDRTTLNRNMKPLIESGLIWVCAGKDLRTRQIRLTDSGRVAINKGWEQWQEAQVAMKEYLGEEDLLKLTQLLSRLEALVP